MGRTRRALPLIQGHHVPPPLGGRVVIGGLRGVHSPHRAPGSAVAVGAVAQPAPGDEYVSLRLGEVAVSCRMRRSRRSRAEHATNARIEPAVTPTMRTLCATQFSLMIDHRRHPAPPPSPTRRRHRRPSAHDARGQQRRNHHQSEYDLRGTEKQISNGEHAPDQQRSHRHGQSVHGKDLQSDRPWQQGWLSSPQWTIKYHHTLMANGRAHRQR